MSGGAARHHVRAGARRRLGPGGDRSARRVTAVAIHVDGAVRQSARRPCRLRHVRGARRRFGHIGEARRRTARQPRRRGARGVASSVPAPCHLQRGRGGHASQSAPQRARGPRRRSPDFTCRAGHIRSTSVAELRSRPDHQEPHGRDLTRGVAHRVDSTARLDRWGATRRPCPATTRRSDARMDRRRPRCAVPAPGRTPRTGARLGRHHLGAVVRARTVLPQGQRRRTRP